MIVTGRRCRLRYLWCDDCDCNSFGAMIAIPWVFGHGDCIYDNRGGDARVIVTERRRRLRLRSTRWRRRRLFVLARWSPKKSSLQRTTRGKMRTSPSTRAKAKHKSASRTTSTQTSRHRYSHNLSSVSSSSSNVGSSSCSSNVGSSGRGDSDRAVEGGRDDDSSDCVRRGWRR